MNSSRTTRRIAIVALFLIAAFVPVFAANPDTATITVVGHVTPSISITATYIPGLDLDIMQGADKVAIANVTEFSNYKGGYAVTLGSTRGWKLGQTTSGSGTESWAYTLYYGTVGGTKNPVTLPTTGEATLTAQTGTSGKSSGGGTAKVLYISFLPPTNSDTLNADTYNDTLVFTITGT